MSNLQLTCPKCGVFNDINETKCWKCKRPISDEEKQKVLNDLSPEEREQHSEQEAQRKAAQNTQTNVVADSTDYKTSILVAKIVSAVGWLTCVAAVVIVISALAAAGKMGALAIAPGLGVLIGGLILVIAGQSSRAVMDNTNYSRLMLEEMRKKA